MFLSALNHSAIIHAWTVQSPHLMSKGEGLMPSVLAFASEQSFIGPNMATISDQPGRYMHESSKRYLHLPILKPN